MTSYIEEIIVRLFLQIIESNNFKEKVVEFLIENGKRDIIIGIIVLFMVIIVYI